jgi:hypothetical protein
MLRHATLIALLALSPAALAKSTTKMTEAELIDTLQHHKSTKQREKAADELGERRAVGALDALGAACAPQEHVFVCEHALWALEKFKTPDGNARIEAILLDTSMQEYRRKMAMRVLARADRARLGLIAPIVLSNFRSMEGDFVAPLVEAMVEGGNTAAADLTILIATDLGTDRRGRIAALDAAEAFRHPRLYEAQMSLLRDEDKKIAIRCAKDLGRSGLPHQEVVPALLDAARGSDKGDVRAAAWGSLRKYASPELLPAVHTAITTEMNILALGHVYILFEALADQSSVPVLSNLVRNEKLPAETSISLIHTAIRIGDPAVIPSLQTLADLTQEPQVRTEALAAIDLLRGPQDALVMYVGALPMLDVSFLDLSVQVPVAPPLAVAVDANGSVSWSTNMNFGGIEVSAGMSVSE